MAQLKQLAALGEMAESAHVFNDVAGHASTVGVVAGSMGAKPAIVSSSAHLVHGGGLLVGRRRTGEWLAKQPDPPVERSRPNESPVEAAAGRAGASRTGRRVRDPLVPPPKLEP